MTNECSSQVSLPAEVIAVESITKGFLPHEVHAGMTVFSDIPEGS